MGRQLKVSTIVPAPYGSGGETFRILEAGKPVPDWAKDLVGDHLFEEPADPGNVVSGGDGSGDDGPPPKTGRGSGAEAWVAYAKAHDVVVVDDDAKRDDVIAALEAAGVATEKPQD